MIYPNINEDTRSDNLAIQVFGKRIYEGQTLFEYFLEFLLICNSDKEFNGEKYSFGFPQPTELNEESKKIKYYPIPRIGLKRFIFFSNSKNENRFEVDEEAYIELVNQLEKKINIYSDKLYKKDAIKVIQDLLYGFNAVVRNRSWFVQSLLPICPELTFCESMGYKKDRKDLAFDITDSNIDEKFDFNGHYFMARGGEVYYLHVLQGLSQIPDLKPNIENGLKNLINSYPEFSLLSKWIETIWKNYVEYDVKNIKKECEWIPSGYARRAKFTCIELSNFLSSKINPLQAMEVLSCGIVLQILRMMHEQAATLVDDGVNLPVWIMDIAGNNERNIKKHSIASYNECEETLISSLYLYLGNRDEINKNNRSEKSDIQLINDAMKNSHKLFRKLGKEIGLIVPSKGPGMRFTLSETLLKFLVLSLIPPGEKLTLSSFLQKIYQHFKIAIGPNQVNQLKKEKNGYPYFDTNELAFQEMLKKSGFLRDLSDATSVVENPYERIGEI